MKFSLCFAAAALLLLSSSCTALDENQIFKDYEEGWQKFSVRFLLSKMSWQSDKLDTVAKWLCPASTLFDLKMKNVLNARLIDTHRTPKDLVNQNNGVSYNPSSRERILETTEYGVSVTESTTQKTSTSVLFKNEIVVEADAQAEPEFRIREKLACSQGQKGSNIVTCEVGSSKRVITTPAQRVTLKPHSKIQVANYLYRQQLIKNYLLDIELDREESQVHWKDCVGFRLAHRLRHPFTRHSDSSYLTERDIENHINGVWSRHQQAFLRNDGRIEYQNGKMIVKNVPVQIISDLYTVEKALGEPEPMTDADEVSRDL